MNFDEAFDRLIGHEGGYVDDPRDPGGETKYGISKRAYPSEDIKNLSRERAKFLYHRDYWLRAKCDEYDAAIAFQLFDAAVNHGIGNGSRMLQRAVGVADDGIIGSRTLAAIRAMNVNDVLLRFNAERLHFYCKLSTFDRFGKGWVRRVADNLAFAARDNG